MKKDDIIRRLEWSEEELHELAKKKQQKANNILSSLISKRDEEGAMILAFDKTLEVNAKIDEYKYNLFFEAVGANFIEFIQKAYIEFDLDNKLDLNFKNPQNPFQFHQNLARSNSPELYDFIATKKLDKTKLLKDTFSFAVGMGKLNLIKHLIDKKIDGKYMPFHAGKAISAYFLFNDKDKDRDKDIEEQRHEYLSYFADIENQTKNTNINEQTKKEFFNEELLSNISSVGDDKSFDLYMSLVSREEVQSHLVLSIKKDENKFNNGDTFLLKKYSWLFLKLHDLKIKISLPKEEIEILSKNKELMHYYERVNLNINLDYALIHKETTEKKLKI